MTITAETTNTVTLDTEDGTIIRLINDYSLTAQVGALAVVDRSLTRVEQDRYLPVTWLSGHSKEQEVGGERKTYTQMDGGYHADAFEVFEFQVGDRVRVVNSLFENGSEGVIVAIPATNGDDCVVDMEFPHNASLSYLFDRLVKVDRPDPLISFRDALMRAFGQVAVAEEPPVDLSYEQEDFDYYDEDETFGYDEEPLAEWEKELLYGGEPVSLNPGDIAVLAIEESRKQGDEMDMSEWEGLRFVVGINSTEWDFELLNDSIDSRPDQYEGDFFWPKGQVRAFDPQRDFRVGDIVEADRYGEGGRPARAVVTALEGDFGGDIEVNWTEALSTLVAYGPLGAMRRYLTVVGVQGEEEPEPFEFESGQEVAPEAAADLPDGTVLIVENGVLITVYVGGESD